MNCKQLLYVKPDTRNNSRNLSPPPSSSEPQDIESTGLSSDLDMYAK